MMKRSSPISAAQLSEAIVRRRARTRRHHAHAHAHARQAALLGEMKRHLMGKFMRHLSAFASDPFLLCDSTAASLPLMLCSKSDQW